MNTARVLGVLVAFTVVLPATVRAGDPLDGIDGFVERVMAEWQVPAMVVGVVRGSDVVLSNAHGTIGAEGSAPVTEHTLFHLGSITKSVTVVGLGMLADEGRIDWDAPVRSYLPEFALSQPQATDAVTLRHVVTHTSGLPRHDVLWYAAAFDREELRRRLRYLKLTEAPGARFQYSNLMYMIAGSIAGRVAGRTWEAFTRERVLAPLGMTGTRLSIAEFRGAADAARPYILAPRGRVPVDLRDTDAIAPAGAVYSNLADMLRYLRFHLNDGAIDGQTLLRPETAAAMRAASVDAADDMDFDELSNVDYGMEFFVTRYRGATLVYHPGVINGYKGRLSFLPEHGLGIVVLSNLSGRNQAPAIVTFSLIDRLLGLERVDWAGRFREVGRKTRAKRATLRPADRAPPSGAPDDYAGRYAHPGYGWIDIAVDAKRPNGVSGSFNGKAFALVHVDGEMWRVAETTWPIRRGLRMTFEGGGGDRKLRAPIADGPTYRFTVGDVTFRRTTP